MKSMKQSVPTSVDEYIAAQPEAMGPRLEQVRAAIRRAVPEAVEGIGYRMPGYKLHGKPMLYFRQLQGALFTVCRIGNVSSRRSNMNSGAMSCERGRSSSPHRGRTIFWPVMCASREIDESRSR